MTGTLLGSPPRTLQGETDRKTVEIRFIGYRVEPFEGRLPEPFRQTEVKRFPAPSQDGTPFELAFTASYTVRRTEQGPYIQGAYRNTLLAHPTLAAAERTPRALRHSARKLVRPGRAAARCNRCKLDYPYTYESTLNPTLLTGDTVSLLETSYYDTGGAHPNTGYRSLTFYRTDGEVVRLELKDLFVAGADYRPVLLKEINRKLRSPPRGVDRRRQRHPDRARLRRR